uniref:Uncharacterized protein n=1 Tax=Anguilla anguilla TaxID=7936 RepID=A0A0E9SZF0_ANGAN
MWSLNMRCHKKTFLLDYTPNWILATKLPNMHTSAMPTTLFLQYLVTVCVCTVLCMLSVI